MNPPFKKLLHLFLLLGLLWSCSPKLEWSLDLLVTDQQGPVQNAEVAIDGGFVGITNQQGKLLIHLQKQPGTQVTITFRYQGIDVLRLPITHTLQVPGFYQWISSLDLQGRGHFAQANLAFPRLNLPIPVTVEMPTEQNNLLVQDQVPVAEKGLEETNLADDGGHAIADKDRSNAVSGGEHGTGLAQQGTKEAFAIDEQGVVKLTETGLSERQGAADQAASHLAKRDSPVSEANSAVVAGQSLQTELPNSTKKDLLQAKEVVQSSFQDTADTNLLRKLSENSANQFDNYDKNNQNFKVAESENVTLTVQAMSDGKPLEGAVVYTARRSARRLVELGRTGVDGILESRYPAALIGETIFLRHRCCYSAQLNLPKITTASQFKPVANLITNAAEARKVRADLVPGVNHDFFLRYQSYGVPRLFEKMAVMRNGQTLELSNSLGIASIPAKNLPPGNTALEFYSTDAIPLRKNDAFVLEDKTEMEPFFVTVSRSRLPSPVIGFFETLRGNVVYAESHLVGEPLFRRARREFMSRFVQAKTFQPLIFSELLKLVQQAGSKPEKIAKDGWELSHLQGEFDYLVSLEMSLAEGLGVKLIDAAGRVLWREHFTDTKWLVAPEIAGKKAFEALLANIPFEIAVLAQKPPQSAQENHKRVVEIGDEKHLGLAFSSGTKFEVVWSPEKSALSVTNNIRGCQGVVAEVPTKVVFANCPQEILPGTVLRRCNARCEFGNYLGETKGSSKDY